MGVSFCAYFNIQMVDILRLSRFSRRWRFQHHFGVLGIFVNQHKAEPLERVVCVHVYISIRISSSISIYLYVYVCVYAYIYIEL